MGCSSSSQAEPIGNSPNPLLVDQNQNEIEVILEIFDNFFKSDKKFIEHFSSVAMKLKRKAETAKETVRHNSDKDNSNSESNTQGNEDTRKQLTQTYKALRYKDDRKNKKTRESKIVEGSSLIAQRFNNLQLAQKIMRVRVLRI